MWRNKGAVYQIYCKATRMFYYGISDKVVDRLESHANNLRNGSHSCRPMLNDYKEFGVIYFTYDVLEYIDDADERKRIEDRLITQGLSRNNIYNSRVGQPTPSRNFGEIGLSEFRKQWAEEDQLRLAESPDSPTIYNHPLGHFTGKKIK